jgi:hypothetical protein
MIDCDPQEIIPVVLSPVALHGSIPSRLMVSISRHSFPVPRQRFRRLKTHNMAESTLDRARGHPESNQPQLPRQPESAPDTLDDFSMSRTLFVGVWPDR